MGTPVMLTGNQPGGPTTFNHGRYEGLLRQLPPGAKDSGGSITMGTPVMPVHPDLARKKEMNANTRSDGMQKPGLPVMYDPLNNIEQYYKRMSPNTAPGNYPVYPHSGHARPHLSPHVHPSGASFPGYSERPLPHHQAKPGGATDPQLMMDFNTARQMQTRRGSISGEKDNRSASPLTVQAVNRAREGGGSPHTGMQHARIPNIYTPYSGAGHSGQSFQSPGGEMRYPSYQVDRSQTPVGLENRQQSPSNTWKSSPNSPNYTTVRFPCLI